MPIISLFFVFCQILLLVTVKGDGNYSRPSDYGSTGVSDGSPPLISSGAEKTVDEFLSKFEALSARTDSDDVGVLMAQLSQNVSSFFELALPVGSLIAGALQISDKPESEQYKAMEKLHDNLMQNLKNWTRKLFNSYEDNIEMPLTYFRYPLSFLMDPKLKKNANEVTQFRELCDSPAIRQSPYSLLNYIYFYTARYCKNEYGLSKEQISMLAHFMPLLRKVRLQLDSDYAKEKFDEMEPGLILWFSSLEDSGARNVLRKMESAIVKAFLFETGTEKYRSGGTLCMLRDVIIGTNYERKAIEELENVIRLEVLQLMAFESMCANLTFTNKSSSYMDWHLNYFKNRTIQILDGVSQFVWTELENSFPEIEIGVIKSKIDEMRWMGPISKNNLTIAEAKSQIFDALDKVGRRKFVRRGFVSANLRKETNFVVRCAVENCFLLSDYEGLDVMVTRFDAERDEKRAEKANEWLKKCQQNGTKNKTVERTLRQFIDQNYNIGKVSELLDNFEKQNFNLTNDALYRNIAILRDYGSSDRCGLTVSSNDRPSDNQTTNGVAMVDYYFAGYARQDINFVFHFFPFRPNVPGLTRVAPKGRAKGPTPGGWPLLMEHYEIIKPKEWAAQAHSGTIKIRPKFGGFGQGLALPTLPPK
ncbi:hypothetical protein niasHT_001738 [Heterodera trifolii]|uniref:Uncharacterized protein n=1 Tax=Heterodera trifolii TaxID=157864 RepID=A0ABD2MGC5_9BILA